MTIEEVSKRAADLFADSLREYWSGKNTPELPPSVVLLMYWAGTETVEQCPVPPALGFLMNTPRGKNIIFEAMRRMRADVKPDIIAMAYDCHVSTQTDLGDKLGFEAFRKLANEHGTDWMFRNGYATKRDAVMATAQTAEDVVLLVRPYAHTEDGQRWTWFPEQINHLTQAENDGRTKLW